MPRPPPLPLPRPPAVAKRHPLIAVAVTATSRARLQYLYKNVQGNNPIQDVLLLSETIATLVREGLVAKPDRKFTNPVESTKRL